MEIINNKDICIVEKKIKEQIILQPNDLRNTKKCINEYIISKLNKYNNKEGGILIQFSNAKRDSESGEMQDENPFIILETKYRAKIFYPQKGKLVVGKLTQIFQTHICCLVFGQFNCLLWLCNIQKVFKIDENENMFDVHSGKSIEIGEYIQFEILDFEVESEDSFQIIGQLRDKDHHGLCDLIKPKNNLFQLFVDFEIFLMENQEKLIDNYK